VYKLNIIVDATVYFFANSALLSKASNLAIEIDQKKIHLITSKWYNGQLA
jgi:hypothetical protein